MSLLGDFGELLVDIHDAFAALFLVLGPRVTVGLVTAIEVFSSLIRMVEEVSCLFLSSHSRSICTRALRLGLDKGLFR